MVNSSIIAKPSKSTVNSDNVRYNSVSHPPYPFLCRPSLYIPSSPRLPLPAPTHHSRAETLVGRTVGGVGQTADAELGGVLLPPEQPVRDAGLGAHHQLVAEVALRVTDALLAGRHPVRVRLCVWQTHVQAVTKKEVGKLS